ncbi:MAG: ketoacyl-ACP synthase III [Lachnospiraceae bacterium]|nr:ketoacyl-ACP synthase III [Lachnospiraceae bacterium]
MNSSYILGAGCYVPESVVTNDDLSRIVDTSDEWITTRTGIKERHLSQGEKTYEMGVKAVKRALENAKINPEDLDMIICATITPDEFMPATACRIQSDIGAKNAAAFDISAACSGLVFGITIASQFVKTGMYKNICVVGAETLSKVTNWEDRGTCVLFGDGAGAVIVGEKRDENSMEIIAESMISNGDKADILTLEAVPFGNMLKKRPDKMPDFYMAMDGQEVFKFAVKVITDQIKKVTEKANLKVEDISFIVPHQANVRIIETAAKMLSLPNEKFFVNLHKYGNTSSASVGIAFSELLESGKIKKGDNLVMTGFGGGMSAGAILLKA